MMKAKNTFLVSIFLTLKQFNSLQKIKVPALHQLTMRLTVWVNDYHWLTNWVYDHNN